MTEAQKIKHRQQNARRYQRRRMDLGVCSECGQNATLHGRRTCEACRAKRRDGYDFINQKRRVIYREDRLAHRCIQCHEAMPKDHIGVRCEKCAMKQKEIHRRKREHEQNDRNRQSGAGS